MAFKIFKYTLIRPLMRFNVENRSKKYLGPDAKKFMPAPRAIGSMSLNGPSQYPHLEGGRGFLSLKQKRLKALESPENTDGTGLVPTDNRDRITDLAANRSYSRTEADDNLVREASINLEVKKLIKLSPAPMSELHSNRLAIESRENANDINLPATSDSRSKPHRPLPTAVNLPLQDVAYMWHVDKVPPGRLSLVKLQELMINKLADEEYWTPKMISEKYDINEEYAEKVTSHLKHIRIVVSPKQAKNLDLVGRQNPQFQATKHVIYYVDPALRSEEDRQFDATFLPDKEDLPESVKNVLETPTQPRPFLKDPSRFGQIMKKPKVDPKQIPVANVRQIETNTKAHDAGETNDDGDGEKKR